MDALTRIHAALVPAGALVDTQPVSPEPVVAADGGRLGRLDLSEWLETIREVDRETTRAGLFELRHEESFTVSDTYDDAREFADDVSGWSGTRVPADLAERLGSARPPVTVAQTVRLRLYEARL